MKTTLLVIDLENYGYMLLSLLKELIPFIPALYIKDDDLFNYDKRISEIRTEFTTQIVTNIMTYESNYMLDLLNLPDWRYFEHINEFSDEEVRRALGTTIRSYGAYVYKELHAQIKRFDINFIDDVLLSNATSSYLALTIVHKE